MNPAKFSLPLSAAVILFLCHSLQADFTSIYGGPTYDSTTGNGYQITSSITFATSEAAVGSALKYVNGVNKGPRPVRWDKTGAAFEMEIIGTSSEGFTTADLMDINRSGVATGLIEGYLNNRGGLRPARWDPAGHLTDLGKIGDQIISSSGYAINSSGAVGGFARKYVSGVDKGSFPVRWDSSGLATELGTLGLDANGLAYGLVRDLNDSGAAVGWSQRFLAGVFKGDRAVRWDASSNAAVELGNLGTDASGSTGFLSAAGAINNAGIAVGFSQKYVNSSARGGRAVRWDASGTAITELDNLGTDGSGFTQTIAVDINDAGFIIGTASKYVSGASRGNRAVRWGPSGTAVTELANLGTLSNGVAQTRAYAINSSNWIAGNADKITAGIPLGQRAVVWNPSGTIIQLDTLLNPASGWEYLERAYDITDDNWVTGSGRFDPDGAGPLAAYDRYFLMQVPDPASIGTLFFIFTAAASIRPRRKVRSRRF